MNQHLFKPFRIRLQRTIWGTLGLALLAAGANAQTTIYDTTGGNTTFTFPAYQIGPDPYYQTACEFGVTTSTNLYSIGLFLYDGGTYPTSYTVELTNYGLNQPGSVIDTWTTAGSNSMTILTPNATDSLGVGIYDVVVSSATGGAWSLNYFGFMGETQFYGPDGWMTSAEEALPQMQVNVTSQAVPEPISLLVMGAGVSGLLLRRRSSRKQNG